MKSLWLLLVLAGLAGCVGSFPVAPELRHVVVRRVDSPAFFADKVWLTRAAEVRAFAGYFGRHLMADAGDATLEVRVLAADGSVLQRATRSLAAAEFHGARHLAPVAFFRVTLAPPPKRIATGEVRALSRP